LVVMESGARGILAGLDQPDADQILTSPHFSA
jgi:hypothetical protein